jgi:hypothetical protein
VELEQHLQKSSEDQTFQLLEQLIKQAEQVGKARVVIPNTDTEVSIDEAKELLNKLKTSKKIVFRAGKEPLENLQKKRKILCLSQVILKKQNSLNKEWNC